MRTLRKYALYLLLGFFLLVVALDVWGYLTLGSLTPATDPVRDERANEVVMVFGATGSVGDGLLKAVLEDPGVEKIYIVTRRSSPRIEAAVASDSAAVIMQEDFTDYSGLSDILGEVNTVLWALGTSSLNVDDRTYTKIHVDFPIAFISEWLSARRRGPMAFHFVTGMGTDPEGSAHWAREKGRAEREMTALAEGTGLRSFSYRSGFIRPTSEQANVLHYMLESLLRPGKLVISARDLGAAMLEISARTDELANGTIVDNADSIRYAEAYRETSLNRTHNR